MSNMERALPEHFPDNHARQYFQARHSREVAA
jgi:hypothetical protein